jgi:hypothetical protein
LGGPQRVSGHFEEEERNKTTGERRLRKERRAKVKNEEKTNE